MAPRISPPGRNAAAQALLELYQSTERRIIREIARKRTQGYVDYAELAALRRVRRTIQQMVDKSAKYVPLAIEHEFYKGKEAKKGYENALSVAGSPERDRVMEQLVDNLMGEVQEMAQTAYQSAEAQIYLTGRTDPGVYRQSVLRGAIAAQAEGRGALSSVEQVMQSLQQAGITAFVDKAGREWSLSAYGSMAVRTTVRQAQVSAVLTADDHDLWKIKEIGSTCPLCAVYEGRVYSKSGLNPNYPPLAAAFGKMDPAGPNDLSNTFLNIHPNCLHSLVKWTEYDKTDEEIEAARKFSSFETNPRTNDPRTEAQIEAYRNKERQRAAYRRSLDQFDRYTKAGIEDFPKSMATFLKHKQADDEKYKAWMAEYRKIEKPKKPEKPKAPDPVSYAARDVEKRLAESGVADKVFLSSDTPAETARAIETTLTGLRQQGYPTIRGVIYNPKACAQRGAAAFYDHGTNSIYIGKRFLSSPSELAEVFRKAEERHAEEAAKKQWKHYGDEAVANARKLLGGKLKGYEKSEALNNLKFGLMLQGEAKQATVCRSIEDVLSHEYGHAMHLMSGVRVPNTSRDGTYWATNTTDKSIMPYEGASQLGAYALQNPLEAVAEAFAVRNRGGQIPQFYADLLREIDEKVKK